MKIFSLCLRPTLTNAGSHHTHTYTLWSLSQQPSRMAGRQVCHIRGVGGWTGHGWWETSALAAGLSGSEDYRMRCQHCDKNSHTYTQRYKVLGEKMSPVQKHIPPPSRQHSLNCQVTCLICSSGLCVYITANTAVIGDEWPCHAVQPY